jgi:dephospho-CoA kinase
MIIGLAGTLGSGKGTVVEYLKARGYAHYSSSGILKEILADEGKVATRENMSNLATELAKKQPGGVLAISHARAQVAGAQNYILEAIHRPEEAEYIRSIGGHIIGIDADTRVRFERITRRREGEKDNVTFEQFLSDSQREDEGKTGTGPNIRAVLREADAVIENNGSLDILYREIDQVIGKITSSQE